MKRPPIVDLGDRVGVLVGEGRSRAGAEPHAALRDVAGSDDGEVRAERADLPVHEVAGPDPIATMAITVATPITIPSIVRRLRRAFAIQWPKAGGANGFEEAHAASFRACRASRESAGHPR